jgi:hypothetical protein
MSNKDFLIEIEQMKCYCMLNHGPTVIVSTQTGQVVDPSATTTDSTTAMTAAWNLVLDFPNQERGAKISVVLDKITKTRDMIVESGLFCVQIPCLRQLKMTNQLGNTMLHTDPLTNRKKKQQKNTKPNSGNE